MEQNRFNDVTWLCALISLVTSIKHTFYSLNESENFHEFKSPVHFSQFYLRTYSLYMLYSTYNEIVSTKFVSSEFYYEKSMRFLSLSLSHCRRHLCLFISFAFSVSNGWLAKSVHINVFYSKDLFVVGIFFLLISLSSGIYYDTLFCWHCQCNSIIYFMVWGSILYVCVCVCYLPLS